VESIQGDFLPSTMGKEWRPDADSDVRMVREGQRGARVVIKPSFGFGGQNGCLVFARP